MVSLVAQHISGRQELRFSELECPAGRAGEGTMGGQCAHPSAGTLDLGSPVPLVHPQLLPGLEGLPAPRNSVMNSPCARRGFSLACGKGFSLRAGKQGPGTTWLKSGVFSFLEAVESVGFLPKLRFCPSRISSCSPCLEPRRGPS